MRSLLNIAALSKRLTGNFAGRQSTILMFNFERVCLAQLNNWTKLIPPYTPLSSIPLQFVQRAPPANIVSWTIIWYEIVPFVQNKRWRVKCATTESFDQWLEAWSAHEKTYLTNPARYAELAQYRSIIQKANWKFRWKAVYDFDVQFWTSLSGTTKQLDQIDSTLYTTILDSSAVRAEGTSCQHCKLDHHLVWDCSFRTKQTLESKVSSKVSTSAMSQRKFAKWFHNSLDGCNLYQRKAC